VRVVGIIPCRYGAVRFPGKALADIHGKPMMWHVYERASKAKHLDEIHVATDDDRIASACRDLDLPVIMTRLDHATGTDRLAECAESIVADVYVNVQGDEPMIAPEAIDLVTEAIMKVNDPRVLASNGFTAIHEPADVTNVNTVKVTMVISGLALAYSRSPIPYPKDGRAEYNRQLGLYAFRKAGLETFARLKPGPLELAEGVEMLRFLEHGYGVSMVGIPDGHAISVDTPADLERVRRMISPST
jgi:3-deoxy-manno-octulosonate cytidylyltransferase (CMP-KDO synthetase)